jgi:4-hydroxybenzoate polyprenyltransferase
MYEFGTYILGLACAFSLGHSVFSVAAIVFALYFLYPANILIYGINDIFDYETDKLNPKKVAYEALVTPEEHWPLIFHVVLLTFPFLVVGIFFLGAYALAWFGLFIFFASFYSAPPIRAKARPLLDSFFSAGHYVATGIFGYVVASGDTQISHVLLPFIGGVCWAMAMHAYSAVPDIAADSTAGLKTIATLLGVRGTIALCVLLYLAATAVAFVYIGALALPLGAVYVVLMALSYSGNVWKYYTYFPYVNTIAGMVLFFALLLR